MTIHLKKLTPELAADFFRLFEETAFPDHPEWGCGCYCCFFHAATGEQWNKQSPADNRAWAAELIANGKMNGLLAYDGDLPVGWCHYNKKTTLPGIVTFLTNTETADDGQIGSIVCFTVAQNYRRQGIARQLLAQACEDLASMGCTYAEAYPRAHSGNHSWEEESYLGPQDLYLSMGFTEYTQHNAVTVVRKKLK